MNNYTVFDIETDGLIDDVTLIHCLSYHIYEDGDLIKEGSITDYLEMELFLLDQKILIGHNIIRYDIPVINKILGITISCQLIDTLALSWYLYPMRIRHGLEIWGEELGIKKPEITDWKTLKLKDYIHRCEEDVKINSLLYVKLMEYLNILYMADVSRINALIGYLCFKMDCAREQEEVKCKIDVKLVDESLAELYKLRDEKIRNLSDAMPLDMTFKTISKPSKMYKKDESISSAGLKWLQLLTSLNLPGSYEDDVVVVVDQKEGNPSSSKQLKDWLYTLGWEPTTFEHRKNKAGVVKAVPQIYLEDEVCPSIKKLYSIEPSLESLNMLSLINHRIGVFEGLIEECDEDGFTRAQIAGFTNTLRFKHRKPIVNLPKVFKFYGDKIRGSIITPNEDSILCGSDMSSLEDSTKQHYMYFFDPEYVKQMRIPGFDPHLDIAVLANMLTPEQVEEHKKYSNSKGEIGTDYSEIRNLSKVVNFSAVYGAGPPKIAQTTGMSLGKARALHKTYWDRNKAVKQVAKTCIVKSTYYEGKEQKWLYNPVSGFWYSLRFDKDRFSTLNQGTGVYCFDFWIREVRKKSIKIMLQYHDEIAFSLPKGKELEVEQILLEAISEVNKNIKLNVPLGVSVDFGENYSQIH